MRRIPYSKGGGGMSLWGALHGIVASVFYTHKTQKNAPIQWGHFPALLELA